MATFAYSSSLLANLYSPSHSPYHSSQPTSRVRTCFPPRTRGIVAVAAAADHNVVLKSSGYGLGSNRITWNVMLKDRMIRTPQKEATAAGGGGVARAEAGTENILSLAVAVVVPLVAGVIDSLVNSPNTPFYKNLKKPSWNPPNWLFGVAWGILYPVMGVASWLVWVQGGWQEQSYPLTVYVVQLVLNLLWPALFFGAKKIGLALLDIVALAGAIVVCIRAFKPVNGLAANLLIPYLAWVVFATALNYSYYQLNNRQSGGEQQFISQSA